MFEIASELDVAFATQATRWRALIARVRAVYSGPLFLAANAGQLRNITFWDALDAIGVDAYYGLGDATLPLTTVPSVADLVTAWAPIATDLAALAAETGKQILFTEVGYQSRPSCHVRPWGTVVHDPLDDSAWLEDHDPACQANAYEALLRTFSGQSWWGGVFWWLWRGDPTAGGTGCSDFSPHGKPAEVVLRRWYGASVQCPAVGSAYGQEFLAAGASAARAAAWWSPSAGMTQPFVPGLGADGDAACDGSAAIIAAIDTATAAAAAAAAASAAPADPRSSRAAAGGTRRKYNGYVFGGPDQWSSPSYRYDSAGAERSLAAMAAAGADTAEIIVQWYVDDVNSTEVYPITDTASPLRTSTDDELRAVLASARALGLQTILTLMIDPNWALPSQNWCRGNTLHQAQCGWRGEIGAWWGENCAPGSKWASFFDSYTPAVVSYARLAASAGADVYLLSHELQAAVRVCPDLWAAQLAAVRGVFAGAVSTAFNPDGENPVLSPAVTGAPWVQSLDFIGIDCYMTPPLPPWNGSGGLSPKDPHPPVPWQDLALSEVAAAWEALMPNFAAVSAATGGKKIVCTEIGWSSRPWAYVYRAGQPRLDPEDCSVADQCVSNAGQAIAYESFMQTLYAQPWFDGVTWWTWRADPTVGGASDDGFSPAGKLAAAAAQNFWGPPA